MTKPILQQPPAFPLGPPPEPSLTLDATVGFLKAGVSALPFAGGPIAEIFGTFVAHQQATMMAEWLKKLQEQVAQLGDRLLDLQDSQKAEEVVATFLAAAQAALRSHQEEKRAALRSVVLNTALAGHDGAEERAIFIRYLDELTPHHLLILRVFQEADTKDENSTDTEQLMNDLSAKGELPGDRDYRKMLLQDLQTRWMLVADHASKRHIRTQEGIVRLTETARRFLMFITEPKP